MKRCKHDFLPGTCGFRGCENQGKLPPEPIMREITTAEGTVYRAKFLYDEATEQYLNNGDGSGETYTEEQVQDLADIDPGEENSELRKYANQMYDVLAVDWGRSREGIRHKYERIHEETFLRGPHKN